MAQEAKPPIWYWIAVSLFVLFEAAGIYLLILGIMTGPAEYEASTGLADTRGPIYWATFAGGLGTGMIGLLALLLRRCWAVQVLLASLVLTILFGVDAVAVLSAKLPDVLTVIVPHALMWLLAVLAKWRGWLVGGRAVALA